jgi:hypothetical protein
MLIFYLFNIQRRHNNIRNIAAKRNTNKEAFEEFSKEITSTEFEIKLQNAVANPASKDAKYVLRKLISMLSSAGKETSYGGLWKNSMFGETYALIRRFGPEMGFLTIAIDNLNCPSLFRLTFKQDNMQFPSTASRKFLDCIAEGKTYVSGNMQIPTNWNNLATCITKNPIASAIMYKRLIMYVIKILIGLKVSKMSDRNGTAIISPHFTHESLNDEAGIIAGHAVATEGCTENNKQGGLHLHAMIFSAICPALLQGCADIQEVCNTVSQVLDSLFCATLPCEYHIKHLLEKELPFYPTADHSFKKLIRRGRAMLMPPDPSDGHQFQDFVYTSISSFGIHTKGEKRPHSMCPVKTQWSSRQYNASSVD